MPARNPTAAFHTTRWSLVTRAGTPGDQARAALDELVEAYWYPLYAFLRRKGESEESAADLVQGFVATLLERGHLSADEERGRFRSYLLGALTHHASNVRRGERAQKRGGDRKREDLEDRYASEAEGSPEEVFDRAWGGQVLVRAEERLREEWQSRGRTELFTALRPTLAGERLDYDQVTKSLDITPSAARVNAHRMRTRLGELIREEVAQTVGSRNEIEDELAILLGALK